MKAAGANAEAEAIMRMERARESCMVFFLVESESRNLEHNGTKGINSVCVWFAEPSPV
jgi:hypothetical protein